MSDNDDPQSYPQALKSPRRIQRREERPTGAVLLADCSFSMSWGDDAQYDWTGIVVPDGTPVGHRRIDRLVKVMAYVLTYTRLQGLVAFNDYPEEIPLSGHVSLPEPRGGTALHLALDYVLRMHPRPVRCVVLSDGCPNDVELALDAARALRPMVIDAYYVGPDENDEALEFMRRLAASGGAGGKSGRFDLAETKQVGEAIRLLIAGPR